MRDIEIEIASDCSHEKVFAEIFVGGKLFGILSKENDEEFHFESPGKDSAEEAIIRDVSLKELETGIQMARDVYEKGFSPTQKE